MERVVNPVSKIIHLLRYRFFFFAGIFPYLLGQAIAFKQQNFLEVQVFWLGFFGIFFVLVAVELFNEYFDFKEGGDRIFLKEKPKIPYHFFPLALCFLSLAFFIGLYLTFRIGWPVLLFSFLGFLGTYFYVGPPIRWAYRGLGEMVIALSYGPGMILGSYYLQTSRVDFVPFFTSLICGLSMFCLSIINEIPDYYQDKLVGKRNLVVRLGKRRSIKLLSFSLTSTLVLLGLGILLKQVPLLALVIFLLLPSAVKSLTVAKRDYDNPKAFLWAINTNIVTYLLIVFSLGLGYFFL